MERECPVCKRRASEGEVLCSYHQRAYLSLREKYERWRKAKEITWEEYLKEVAINPNTGEWVREVAQYLNKIDNHIL